MLEVFDLFATSRSISENCQYDHHDDHDEGHDNREFEERQEETKHNDYLTKQGYDKEDECDDAAQPAEKLKKYHDNCPYQLN
jgi:hypothetical protein